MSILIEELKIVIKKSLNAYLKNLNGENPAYNFYEDMVKAFEKPLIEEALFIMDYNQKKTAEFLGIHRNTLSKKIKQLEIARND